MKPSVANFLHNITVSLYNWESLLTSVPPNIVIIFESQLLNVFKYLNKSYSELVSWSVAILLNDKLELPEIGVNIVL